MNTLTLYFRPFCPYCAKVLSFMEEKKISIPTKNVGDANHQQELVSIGGKPQVPCLSIDGKALYESDAIIEWLENNYK